jgi:hypothetical protein
LDGYGSGLKSMMGDAMAAIRTRCGSRWATAAGFQRRYEETKNENFHFTRMMKRKICKRLAGVVVVVCHENDWEAVTAPSLSWDAVQGHREPPASGPTVQKQFKPGNLAY